MRQIKFRWWVKEPSHPRGGYMNGTFEGEWWLGIEANSGLLVNVVNGKVEDAPDGKIVLMQFTGLLDKNGKEIYEGDIVRYQDYNTRDKDWKVANVYWMDWADWAKVPFLHPFGSPVSGRDVGEGRSVNTVFVTPPGECEVIGNIHENPELLQ